eukprot:363224-Chlamydomonas_euryale.AAC.1
MLSDQGTTGAAAGGAAAPCSTAVEHGTSWEVSPPGGGGMQPCGAGTAAALANTIAVVAAQTCCRVRRRSGQETRNTWKCEELERPACMSVSCTQPKFILMPPAAAAAFCCFGCWLDHFCMVWHCMHLHTRVLARHQHAVLMFHATCVRSCCRLHGLAAAGVGQGEGGTISAVANAAGQRTPLGGAIRRNRLIRGGQHGGDVLCCSSQLQPQLQHAIMQGLGTQRAAFGS